MKAPMLACKGIYSKAGFWRKSYKGNTHIELYVMAKCSQAAATSCSYELYMFNL